MAGTPVEPDHEQVAVAGTKLCHHFFAQPLVPFLPVAGKLAFAFGLEIVDTQQGVPADADVDARLQAVFAAGVYKVAHHVAFSVAPFHGFQAVRIYVTLPQTETGFVRGREDGKLGTGCLGCLYPLVGIQVLGVEDVVILYRVDAVVSLTVYLAVEYMKVVMEHDTHFGLVPFKLVRSWFGTVVVGVTCLNCRT